MANHASALKAHRQSIKRRERNRSNRSALRTVLKAAKEQVKTGENAAGIAALYSEVDKAVRKGVLSLNAAARHKSRITRHLNATPVPPQS